MTQLEKQRNAISFYTEYKGGVEEVRGNVIIIRYDANARSGIKPALALFVGKSAKPTSNYYYANEEKREEEIERVVAREQAIKNEKKTEMERRKAFTPTSKAGDIFVSSWGYEQTNVDFYLLLEVKGKTGTFVGIHSLSVVGSQGLDYDKCVADPTTRHGKEFKKIIQSLASGGEYIAMRSFEYCHKWNGNPQHRSWGY